MCQCYIGRYRACYAVAFVQSYAQGCQVRLFIISVLCSCVSACINRGCGPVGGHLPISNFTFTCQFPDAGHDLLYSHVWHIWLAHANICNSTVVPSVNLTSPRGTSCPRCVLGGKDKPPGCWSVPQWRCSPQAYAKSFCNNAMVSSNRSARRVPGNISSSVLAATETPCANNSRFYWVD